MFASAHRARFVVTALALATPLITAGSAAAQVRTGVRSYSWQGYQAPNQQYGHSGYEDYVPPGYTCSDQRNVSQQCWTDEDGEQRCQTTSERSAQTCQ